MKITFGMPELLVVFSLVIYSQAFWFSIIAFVMGVSGRIIASSADQQHEKRRKDAVISVANNFIDSITGAIAGMGVRPGDGFH